MDIRKLTDKELAKQLLIISQQIRIKNPTYSDFDWNNYSPEQQRYWIESAKFTRQCVKDSQKELVEALKGMIEQYGGMVDGGVEKPAAIAVYRAKQALASVEGKESHVA